jgi:hypothetical protein
VGGVGRSVDILEDKEIASILQSPTSWANKEVPRDWVKPPTVNLVVGVR